MTPAKTGTTARATFRFDRRIKGVGRLALSSGARTRREHQRREGIVTKLVEAGALDTLRALRDGRITMADLVAADRRGVLATSPEAVALDRPLWTAVESALKAMDSDPVTVHGYRKSWARLREAGALSDGALVGDLAAVDWRALERGWGRSPAHWNHLRRAVSRTLTELLADRQHPFVRGLRRAIPERQESPRVPDLTPEGFHAILVHLPAVYHCYVWALVGTGLRGGELWQVRPADLLHAAQTVLIRRRVKNRTSTRELPLDADTFGWVRQCVQTGLGRDYVRARWNKACDAAGVGRVHLHDLRHCFGQWSLDAGVPDADVQAVLGHATPYMTRLYRARLARRQAVSAVAGLVRAAGTVRVDRQRGVGNG